MLTATMNMNQPPRDHTSAMRPSPFQVCSSPSGSKLAYSLGSSSVRPGHFTFSRNSPCVREELQSSGETLCPLSPSLPKTFSVHTPPWTSSASQTCRALSGLGQKTALILWTPMTRLKPPPRAAIPIRPNYDPDATPPGILWALRPLQATDPLRCPFVISLVWVTNASFMIVLETYSPRPRCSCSPPRH